MDEISYEQICRSAKTISQTFDANKKAPKFKHNPQKYTGIFEKQNSYFIIFHKQVSHTIHILN